MSPRKRKKPEPGAEALRWLDTQPPTPLARPGWGEPVRYGWRAQVAAFFERGIRLQAVALDGDCFALADARRDEPDPRVLLRYQVEHRHQGGWSRAPVECYLSPHDALLALRLQVQREFARRLADLDAAIGGL